MNKNICPKCNGKKDGRASQCFTCQHAINSEIKKCNKCNKELPLSEFRTRTRKKFGTRPRSTCKDCERKYNVCYLDKKNTKQTKEQKRRRTRLTRIYRLGLKHIAEKILALFETQIECSICGKIEKNNKELHIDHNHDTGEFRGLLCHQCNCGLGYFKDNIEFLEKAIGYLKPR